ncbi:hypothetical protein A9O66_20635 [Paraburkholderia caribensis]|uniref:Uncharacterized protein n=1 Tax=Paraburkholderia caribensis TaxID=75105 RepID=A0A9Q6WN81_9BURK|nr:hypothetical protein A9O66_20635 [Paraburkholderia caribensis]
MIAASPVASGCARDRRFEREPFRLSADGRRNPSRSPQSRTVTLTNSISVTDPFSRRCSIEVVNAGESPV